MAKKDLVKSGIRLWANNDKEKIPKAWKVKIVSVQSKRPAPKIILTNWALSKIKIIEVGIMKKIIFSKVEEKLSTNSLVFF